MINLVEVGDHSLFDIHAAVLQATTNVLNNCLSLLIIENSSEKLSWLLIVIIRMLVSISTSITSNSPLVVCVGFIFSGSVQRVRLVVGTVGVAVSHWETISLVVGNLGSVWAIDRNLLIVRSKTMSVSIWVREETTLEHLVVGWFNTWH